MEVALVDDAITSDKYDETTAWPVTGGDLDVTALLTDTNVSQLLRVELEATVDGDPNAGSIAIVAQQLATALESDGDSGYQFTTTALENGPGSSFDPNTTPVQVSSTAVTAIAAGTFDPNATPVQLSTTALAAVLAEFPIDANDLMMVVLHDISSGVDVATTDDLDSTITANASISAVTTTVAKLDDLVVDSGGGAYILTAAALANAPSGGLNAAQIRAALGLAEADLDTQLGAIDGAVESPSYGLEKIFKMLSGKL